MISHRCVFTPMFDSPRTGCSPQGHQQVGQCVEMIPPNAIYQTQPANNPNHSASLEAQEEIVIHVIQGIVQDVPVPVPVKEVGPVLVTIETVTLTEDLREEALKSRKVL